MNRGSYLGQPLLIQLRKIKMANKNAIVEIMVEQINIQSRQAAVMQKQDLVELEKHLLSVQEGYRQMCGGMVDALIARGAISVDE